MPELMKSVPPTACPLSVLDVNTPVPTAAVLGFQFSAVAQNGQSRDKPALLCPESLGLTESMSGICFHVQEANPRVLFVFFLIPEATSFPCTTFPCNYASQVRTSLRISLQSSFSNVLGFTHFCLKEKKIIPTKSIKKNSDIFTQQNTTHWKGTN